MTLSARSSIPVQFNYTTEDYTAHDPSDYTSESGIAYYAPATSSEAATVTVTVDIPVLGYNINQPQTRYLSMHYVLPAFFKYKLPRYFTFTLSEAENCTVGGPYAGNSPSVTIYFCFTNFPLGIIENTVVGFLSFLNTSVSIQEKYAPPFACIYSMFTLLSQW